MTTQQIVGLALVGGIFLWAYLPNLKSMLSLVKVPVPSAKPQKKLLDHIEAVCLIREQYSATDVTKACNSLLETLLKVKA